LKFLIDECPSPELVALARKQGHAEWTHVTWLGMRSRKDWSIVRRAIDDAYVLVTNNTTDFAALLSNEHVHAGLVCVGLMSLDVQRRLFALALDCLGDEEPVNEMLAITLGSDQSVRVERYDLPATRWTGEFDRVPRRGRKDSVEWTGIVCAIQARLVTRRQRNRVPGSPPFR
jgi:predicted nuclease of predicted toxin-antitoxin system